MSKKITDIMILSFALFAMYFGAGNLIFPPMLGAIGGENWLVGLLGFLISEVGLIAVGLIAATISDGKVEKFAEGLPKWLTLIIFVGIALILGPLFVVPRTAATTFEIAVLPLIQDSFSERGIFWINIFSNFVFFGIMLIFVLTPSTIIDKIGKFLTPFLILVLVFLIFKGIFVPIGPILSENIPHNLFATGLREGYQTMDALAAVLFGALIINTFTAKGYEGKKNIFRMALFAVVFTCVGLALCYTGLAYLGATSSTLTEPDVSRTMRLVVITQALYGSVGSVLLSISVALACLTTSIGLIGSISEYFKDLFSIPLKRIVIALTVVSFFISIIGVEGIILFAAPILEVLYPIVIVLFFIVFFAKFLPNLYFKRGAVIGAGLVGLCSALLTCDSCFGTNFSSTPLKPIIDNLPFSDIGLAWSLPALVCCVVFGLVAHALGAGKQVG